MVIIEFYLLCSLVKNGLAQYDQYIYNTYNDYNTNLQEMPRNINPSYDGQWDMNQEQNYEETPNYPNNYILCTCETCNNPKPCCTEFCKRCPQMYNYNEQLKYVFMPFSYSFTNFKQQNLTDNNITEEPTTESTTTPQTTTETTTSTTTTTTTTTTPTPTPTPTTIIVTTESTVEIETSAYTQANRKRLSNRNSAIKFMKREGEGVSDSYGVKERDQFMLTSLRRTKPNWIPNYGIVPISDRFAENLMLQLRSMKVLHPRENNIRNVDEMSPV